MADAERETEIRVVPIGSPPPGTVRVLSAVSQRSMQVEVVVAKSDPGDGRAQGLTLYELVEAIIVERVFESPTFSPSASGKSERVMALAGLMPEARPEAA